MTGSRSTSSLINTSSPNNTYMNYISTLQEKLRQPIPYQWRVQSRNKEKTKAICSAYIDARDVMNVLDKYCEHGWQSDVKELAGFIFYGIGITVPMEHNERGEVSWSETQWRWDTGARIEDNKSDNMYEQAGKSAASDALKRAAVQWGVGRFLYDLPTVTLPCDQNGNVVDESGKRVWDLTKHINNLKGNAPAVSTPAPELPELPQSALDSMLAFISEGKIKEVEAGMKKYKLNTAQKTTLTSMINQVKSEAVTKAAKK